jgi:hypothetical protein
MPRKYMLTITTVNSCKLLHFSITCKVPIGIEH